MRTFRSLDAIGAIQLRGPRIVPTFTPVLARHLIRTIQSPHISPGIRPTVVPWIFAPIFSAIIPDLVAPDDVPQAIGLNSVAYNGAQSLGPALGGVLVAAAGPAAVFLLNAVSFLGIVAVAGGWPARADHDDSERPLAAMRAGISHVRHDRRLAPIALRITLAFFASSAIVALLPVVARTRLRAEAWQFGLLSASLGAGVVVAVMVQPRLRGRMRTDSTVFVASALWAVGAAVLGWTTHLAVAIPALLLAACSAPPPTPKTTGIDSSKLIDLSYTFDDKTVYWPNAEGFRHRKDSWTKTPGGYWYAAGEFTSAEHGGTHLDAPVHFSEGKLTLDQLPVERLVAPAQVIERLKAYEAMGYDEFSIWLDSHMGYEQKRRSLQLFIDLVLPAFQ